MQKTRLITGGLIFVCLFFLVSVQWIFAEVAKIEITSRQVFADGMKFGDVGAYEKIKGRLHYSVDPGNPANAGIIDLKYAPKNARDMVEFAGEFILLKPMDLQKGNHRMIFDVSNSFN